MRNRRELAILRLVSRALDKGADHRRAGPRLRSAAVAMPGAVPALVVVVVATVLAYSNTFHVPFTFDDRTSIVWNDTVRGFGGDWRASRYVGHLSFALNYRLGGLNPVGFHVTNLAIHLCNAFLVFWLTALTLRTPAIRDAEAGPLVRRYLPASAASLFALHPLATQAVTYVVQRFASLATLFFVLSLALYVKARLSIEAEPRRKAPPSVLLALSTLAAVAAMRTKEISFSLPFLVAGYEVLLFPRRRLAWTAPLTAAALLVPLGRIGDVQGFEDPLENVGRLAAEAPELSRWAYLLTQSRVVVTYLRLLVLPSGQNLDYDFRLSHALTEPSVLASLAILAGVVGAAAFLLVRARRTNRAPGVLVFFGVAWLFLTLSVESSIIPIRDVIFEHRMYLPSAGAVVTLATLLLGAVERLTLPITLPLQAALALALTAGPLGVASYARNAVWRDEVVLWSDVVAKSPRKARPRFNLANALLRRRAADEAVRQYLVALEIRPAYPEALGNLGGAYVMLREYDQAIRVLREALSLSPNLNVARVNLGSAYLNRGEPGAAIQEFRAALEARPDDVPVLSMLGAAYTQVGNLDDAIAALERAVTLDPRSAVAHNNLGLALAAQGALDSAAREYREALRLNPSLSEPRANLTLVTERKDRARTHNAQGAASAAKGRLDDAAREYREAIRLDPELAEAHTNLGAVLMKRGRVADAVEAHRRALALRPLPEIVFNLALALEASGRTSEAIAQYQRFVDDAGTQYPSHAENARARIARLRMSVERSR